MKHLGEQVAPVRIRRHASLYAGAIVMPGVTVGEYAIVREGAVVTDDVPPFTMVAGSPARVIEQLPRDKVDDRARRRHATGRRRAVLDGGLATRVRTEPEQPSRSARGEGVHHVTRSHDRVRDHP